MAARRYGLVLGLTWQVTTTWPLGVTTACPVPVRLPAPHGPVTWTACAGGLETAAWQNATKFPLGVKTAWLLVVLTEPKGGPRSAVHSPPPLDHRALRSVVSTAGARGDPDDQYGREYGRDSETHNAPSLAVH